MYPIIFITTPILNKINVLGLILKLRCRKINLPTHNIKKTGLKPVITAIDRGPVRSFSGLGKRWTGYDYGLWP
jgi:hypothetical protein